jgi:hypothetical protein
MGLSPVAAMKYMKGFPGFAPKTLGEFILGNGEGGGVNKYFSPSLGMVLG